MEFIDSLLLGRLMNVKDESWLNVVSECFKRNFDFIIPYRGIMKEVYYLQIQEQV